MLGLAGVILGIVFWDLKHYEILLIIITSATVTVTFTVTCIRFVFSVGTITYDGEKIDFGNGIIEKPSQILNVEYHNNYFTQRTDVWGSLIVTVGNNVIKYPCIERVGEVGNRLFELKKICLKSETEMSNSSINES